MAGAANGPVRPPSSLRSSLRSVLFKGVGEDQWGDYRWQLANSLRDPTPLKGLFGQDLFHRIEEVCALYPFRVTPYYLSLVTPDDPNDPILRQFWPDTQEIDLAHSISHPDPLRENDFSPVRGVIHRYPDRALILTTNQCTTYCRHCDRKRTWSEPESIGGRKGWAAVMDYLRSHTGIREVILSGGDALIVPVELLKDLLKSLRSLSHVEVIRLATRLPVVLPMAVTSGLVETLLPFRPIWLNTQFNHPREVTRESAEAVERLVSRGIPVSNQAVLLKGINDDLETMIELGRSLERICVRPYYLFQCETVQGVEHFRTGLEVGISIVQGMLGRTGGLTIPNLMLDLPQGGGKVPIAPSHLLYRDDNGAYLLAINGEKVYYPEAKK